MSFKPDTQCSCTVRPAVNFGERVDGLPLDILLLHYTGMESGKAAIDWLCTKESGVSCHYVVDEDGSILQLVPEANRAWHAGQSCWQGETDTNSRSIGIEIVNPGHENGYPEFPEQQIKAVIELCQDILDRKDIPAHNILAHSDVAPGRKRDPGEKFPWQQLYEHGVGIWIPEANSEVEALLPGDESEKVRELQNDLMKFGYCVEPTGIFDQKTENCVTAFQLHFRQSRADGVADSGTRSTLSSIVEHVTS